MIRVLVPGLMTTVQDLGRPGLGDLGVPAGGAADAHALRLGNLLLGNDEGAAALEATLVGPDLLFEEAALVEGCSRARVFWRITLPMMRAPLASAALFVFILKQAQLDTLFFINRIHCIFVQFLGAIENSRILPYCIVDFLYPVVELFPQTEIFFNSRFRQKIKTEDRIIF